MPWTSIAGGGWLALLDRANPISSAAINGNPMTSTGFLGNTSSFILGGLGAPLAGA